jgi:hypothetical protein
VTAWWFDCPGWNPARIARGVHPGVGLDRNTQRCGAGTVVVVAEHVEQHQSKVFQQLSHHDVHGGVQAQLSTGTLQLPPVPLPPGTDRHFATTGELWADVLSERIRARRTVIVHDVLLSEWFPRSPGLFHTPDAAVRREQAQHHLIVLTDEQRERYARSNPPGPDVFDLYGKYQMLAGGIGCVRLNRRASLDGPLWFMSASSTLFAEEGMPVALSDDLYEQYIDEITERGVLPCTVTGKLMLLPDSLLTLFEDYRGVQRVYIHVDRIEAAGHTALERGEDPIVSAAVLFTSDKRRYQMNATYMNFVPGRVGTLDRRLPWLEEYVRGLHDGTVVTDFDEQTTRFPHAVFSLRKVAQGALVGSEIRSVASAVDIHEGQIDRLLVQQAQVIVNQVNVNQRIRVGDTFRNIGAGAVIVNRSSLSNALNTLQAREDPLEAEALKELAAAVIASREPEAMESLNELTEELGKPEPSKHRLKTWLSAIASALPDVAKVAAAAATLSGLWL